MFAVIAVLLWCRFGSVTVVVCPLTALGRQHVNYLQARGVSAATLSTETSPQVRNTVFESLQRRALAVLVVSPEQIAMNTGLCRALEKCGVGLFVVDEAHTWLSWPCWRPSMTQAVARFPTAPRLAMTATLQRSDEPQLLQVLAMPASRVVRHSFFRANLALNVERRPPLISWTSSRSSLRINEAERTFRQRRAFALCEAAARRDGNSIIYVRLRKDVDDLVSVLLQLLSATPAAADAVTILPYHAGRGDRNAVETAFIERRRVVVVSTIAFGLGINSPAVRLVVHMVRLLGVSRIFFILLSGVSRMFFILLSGVSRCTLCTTEAIPKLTVVHCVTRSFSSCTVCNCNQRPHQTRWTCTLSKWGEVEGTATRQSVHCFSTPRIWNLSDAPRRAELSLSTTHTSYPTWSPRRPAPLASLLCPLLRL